MPPRIYLDANSTTPVLPEVLAAMLPYFQERFGNSSSIHRAGQHARAAVERARGQVAALLGARSSEIVFTSGGTEGANLALFGILSEPSGPRRLITSTIEHHAVLHAAEALAERGVEVIYLSPTRDGVVTPESLKEAMNVPANEGTKILVSIMTANNETGVLQPIPKLAKIAHAHGALFHTDAVQAAGKMPLDLSPLGFFGHVDLLSLSGHKLYAPQGTGALFVRKGTELQPMLFGGSQERQRRAGTENLPGIVALGQAAEMAQQWLASEELSGLSQRRDRLEAGLLAAIPGSRVNGGDAPRVDNTLNLQIAGIDAEALVIALDMQGIAASFGAACQSGATEPSHVLLAMGLTPEEARASIRLSLTRLTTEEEIGRANGLIPAAVSRLRSLA